MDNAQALEILTRYNAWRRWDSEHDEFAPPKCPSGREIGQATEKAIEALSSVLTTLAMDDAIAFAMRKKNGGAQ